MTPNFYYIFLYILMYLCCVASLSSFRLQFFELWPFFKMVQNLKKSLYYSPCFFCKKWPKNDPQFLLHFLIHNDVLMLCRKFELIPSSIFRVMAIFKMAQNLKKSLYYSPCFFAKNGQKMTPNFYYIFLYIMMYLCCVESLS